MSGPNVSAVRVERALALAWLLLLITGAVVAYTLPAQLSELDLTHTSAPPFTAGHVFGTTLLGQDVLVALLYGAQTALLVSLPAATLAAVLGVFLGVVSGYWGNSGLRLPAGYALAGGVALAAYALLTTSTAGYAALWWPVGLLLFALALGRILQKLLPASYTLALPIDGVVSAVLTLLATIPLLLLVLALAAASEPSLVGLIGLLVLTFWTQTARLVRAEVLRTRQLSFLDAARAAGLPAWRIMWRHLLPNTWGPVRTAWPLSIAAIIALETTLSFLGVGLPPEVPSWGRVLAESRQAPSAWWLLVFPSLCLLATTLSLRALVVKRKP